MIRKLVCPVLDRWFGFLKFFINNSFSMSFLILSFRTFHYILYI